MKFLVGKLLTAENTAEQGDMLLLGNRCIVEGSLVAR